jgi:predicted lipoprotein
MDIHMKIRLVTAALLLMGSLTACSGIPGVYAYEKDGTKVAGAAEAFDPKTYVDGIWASRIVPTVQQNAVDVTTVAAAIAEDPAAAGKQYGKQSGTGSPFAYMVKGTGTVTDFDADAPTGPLTVEVPGANGAKAVKLFINTGPVIAGTALRDAAGIQFGDFTNQIDYANVANAINNRVKTDVITKVPVKDLKGKKVTFAGAFSALAPGSILLVPTELSAS